MNLTEMRNRLAAILAQLDAFKGVETYSQEDVETINGLSEEFETLSAQIQAAEKIEAMTAKASESTRKAPAAKTAFEKVEIKPSQKLVEMIDHKVLDEEMKRIEYNIECFRSIVK